MKVQFASDLHLEFAENRRFIEKHPLRPAADILILAGDIVPLRQIEEHKSFFDHLSDSYKQVYWIPGNHEFYDLDIANKRGEFIERIRSNVSLLNNQIVELDDCRFYFTTLWSKISKENAFYIERGLSDFSQIRVEGKRFSTEVYNQLHEGAIAFLIAAIKEKRLGIKHNVIVSHHVPTFQHYPSRYFGSVLNEAFASELDELIISSKVRYWIYGHNHAMTPDFEIGTTKLVTNQLGYVFQNENRNFDPSRLIYL